MNWVSIHGWSFYTFLELKSKLNSKTHEFQYTDTLCLDEYGNFPLLYRFIHFCFLWKFHSGQYVKLPLSPNNNVANKYSIQDPQPAHAHRSDVDNSSIFCGKHRRKRYRPDIGNGTRVFDIDIVVRCTYDEIQTTIFIRERHMKYMLTMSNYI